MEKQRQRGNISEQWAVMMETSRVVRFDTFRVRLANNVFLTLFQRGNRPWVHFLFSFSTCTSNEHKNKSKWWKNMIFNTHAQVSWCFAAMCFKTYCGHYYFFFPFFCICSYGQCTFSLCCHRRMLNASFYPFCLWFLRSFPYAVAVWCRVVSIEWQRVSG